MAYKTILVSLNEVARLPQVLEAAKFLGKTFSAHVSGVYVIPSVQFYPSVGYEAMPQFFDGNQIYFKDNAKAVQDSFEKAMKAEGLSCDFQMVNGATANVSDEVIARGHAADLILLSSSNVDAPAGVEPDFVEQVVMAAGRPVLVLPLKGDAKVDLSEHCAGLERWPRSRACRLRCVAAAGKGQERLRRASRPAERPFPAGQDCRRRCGRKPGPPQGEDRNPQSADGRQRSGRMP